MSNASLQLDGYKTGHKFQYPEGTTWILSNLTPRSAKLAQGRSVLPDFDNKIVWFGLQGVIQEFLLDEWYNSFFGLPRDEVVSQYKRRMDTYLGPNVVDVSHIEKLHDLGYLPICIMSLKEGSRVNIGVPVMLIMNTLPEFFWLTNYLETVLSAELWKPATIATIANEYKRLLTQYAVKTNSDLSFVSLQGHDFSFRGMSCRQDAAKSGAAHLLSFIGTDTIPAIDYLEKYYGADAEREMIGCSVPATEHSVMTIKGAEGEEEIFQRLARDVYPTGIFSCVLDGFNLWDVVRPKTGMLARNRDIIMSRQPNAIGLNKTVIRPDSGDPVKIVCGYTKDDFDFQTELEIYTRYDYYKGNSPEVIKFKGQWHFTSRSIDGRVGFNPVPVSEEEVKGVLECLWDEFGGTINEAGYKVLDPHIGLIYGDSITLERAKAILEGMEKKGFASCNIVFGIGSFTYQYITRDTFGFAIKATAATIDGEVISVQKDPITDKGTKKSAKGLLQVHRDPINKTYLLKQECDTLYEGEMEVVFEDGFAHNLQTLEQIRQRLMHE